MRGGGATLSKISGTKVEKLNTFRISIFVFLKIGYKAKIGVNGIKGLSSSE